MKKIWVNEGWGLFFSFFILRMRYIATLIAICFLFFNGWTNHSDIIVFGTINFVIHSFKIPYTTHPTSIRCDWLIDWPSLMPFFLLFRLIIHILIWMNTFLSLFWAFINRMTHNYVAYLCSNTHFFLCVSSLFSEALLETVLR